MLPIFDFNKTANQKESSEEIKEEQGEQLSIARWCNLQNKIEHSAVLIATTICQKLQSEKSFSVLQMFLNALPDDQIYGKNEIIVRAKIAVAYAEKKFQLVYDLMKNNQFENGKDLMELWDKAHYEEVSERKKKPLTALNRFRIRQRFPPPITICPSGRKKAKLEENSKNIMEHWLRENISDPYPTKEMRQKLAIQAGISSKQVKTWFANARRRISRENEKRGILKRPKKKTRLMNFKVEFLQNEKCIAKTCHHEKNVSSATETACNERSQKLHVVSIDKETESTQSSSCDDDELQSSSCLPSISSLIPWSMCNERILDGRSVAGDEEPKTQIIGSFGTYSVLTPMGLVLPPVQSVAMNPKLFPPRPLTHHFDYYNATPATTLVCSPLPASRFYLSSSVAGRVTRFLELHRNNLFTSPCYYIFHVTSNITDYFGKNSLVTANLLRPSTPPNLVLLSDQSHW